MVLNMPFVSLPAIFQPYSNENLTRVGRPTDGGYVVDRRSVLKADCLIGLGLNTDWSFEEEFLKLNDIPLYAFDASINASFFRKKISKNIRKFQFSQIHKSFRIYTSYKHFFNKGHKRHFAKFIGFDDGQKNISFETMMNSYIKSSYKNYFFKIDIERSEYRILEDLIGLQDKTTGLVIEFHDLDVHMDTVKHFIERYQLKLCHIHVNNNGGVNKLTPLVVEMSFSNFDATDRSREIYPTSIDIPNTNRCADYRVEFENAN